MFYQTYRHEGVLWSWQGIKGCKLCHWSLIEWFDSLCFSVPLFVSSCRAVKFSAKLMGQAMAKRVKATILFATETGKSHDYAKTLCEIFKHAFDAKVHLLLPCIILSEGWPEFCVSLCKRLIENGGIQRNHSYALLSLSLSHTPPWLMKQSRCQLSTGYERPEEESVSFVTFSSSLMQ